MNDKKKKKDKVFTEKDFMKALKKASKPDKKAKKKRKKKKKKDG